VGGGGGRETVKEAKYGANGYVNGKMISLRLFQEWGMGV
jgi:hypothetical protein